jgi:hypothetical protein
MRKLFIVGSSIQPREGRFTYSQTRSKFDAQERFRQTIFTTNSIRAAFPDAKIVIVDSSAEYAEYIQTFWYLKDVDFIPLRELCEDAYETVNTHPNKSLCESLLLNTYYKTHKPQIKEYDFVFKATGRYFYYDFNDQLLTEQNKDKIFFKKPLNFEWNNDWRYQFVDRRLLQDNNRLHQYCTVLYGFGSEHLEKFIDINEATIHLLNQTAMSHYDIETLSYYFTRAFEDKIIEVDWKVSGWDGTSGRFMYY